ncbi:hypothetical protein PV797_13820 [Clostridiaceae bacterium M8S5]|nr:hypothetical protein PV797_13820 [Clostridiaceae bacterium M8S5]
MRITPSTIIFGSLIFSLIGFRLIVMLRLKKAYVKGLRRYNSLLMILSVVFIYLAYRYFRGYLTYTPDPSNQTLLDASVYLLNAILWFSIGVFWILKGADKDYINDIGVSTQEGSFNWDRIGSYKWSAKQSKENRKGVTRYYVLTFTTKEKKGSFKWLGSKSRDVSMKIKAADRKKVDAYIKQRLA